MGSAVALHNPRSRLQRRRLATHAESRKQRRVNSFSSESSAAKRKRHRQLSRPQRCAPPSMLRARSAALRARSLLLSHAACAPPAPQLRCFGTDAAEPLRSRRFVDWLRVVARAGNGGSGCVRCACGGARVWRSALGRDRALTPLTRCSFWHAAARKKRGPDGGGGGHGGDVIVRADATVRCLANVATTANAEAGGRGGAQGRAGRRGADMVVRVPVGTVVWHRLGASLRKAPRGRRLP